MSCGYYRKYFEKFASFTSDDKAVGDVGSFV